MMKINNTVKDIYRNILWIIIPIFFLLSCNDCEKKDGYIVFTDSKYFQFLPVKNGLDKNTSISSFKSDNLLEGFQFESTFNLAFYHSIFLHLDTFTLENKSSSLPKNIRTLKILPVRMIYSEVSKDNFPMHTEIYQIRDQKIQCKWNYNKYKIRKVTFYNYKIMNREGSYFEDVSISPPSESELLKIKKSLKNLEKNNWKF
jgi:hypothetical protein